jgi:hypothetical protein
MIPAANQPFIVSEIQIDRINDLVEAMVQSGILPQRMPADRSYIELTQDLDRFDLRIGIAARVEFDVPKLDVIDDGGPSPLVRLSLEILVGEAIISSIEKSTNTLLSQFRFALSGRLAITGEVGIDGGQRAGFFAFKSFEFDLDDYTVDTPLFLPAADLSLLLSRVGDREIRTKLAPGHTLPEKRFPISSSIEDTAGLPLGQLGLIFRNRQQLPDSFQRAICLPPPQGIPSCQPGNAPLRNFYQSLDVFAGFNVAAGQQPVPIVRLGTQKFQVDVGADIIRQQLARYSADPQFHGRKESSFFASEWNLGLSLVQWQAGSDDAGILLSGQAVAYTIGVSVKICHKDVFGVSIPYPCGVEKRWWKVKTLHADVTLRPVLHGTQFCIDRGVIHVDLDTTIWGYILEFLAGTILGIFLPGGTFAWGIILTVVIEMLDEIIQLVVNAIVPDQVCTDIQKFLKVPVVGDRINLIISNPALEFKTTGLSIAADGDFSKI